MKKGWKDKTLENGMPKEIVNEAKLTFQKRFDDIKWDEYYKSLPFTKVL